MKNFIILIMAVVSLAVNATAKESNSESRITIALETHPYDNDYSGERHLSNLWNPILSNL